MLVFKVVAALARRFNRGRIKSHWSSGETPCDLGHFKRGEESAKSRASSRACAIASSSWREATTARSLSRVVFHLHPFGRPERWVRLQSWHCGHCIRRALHAQFWPQLRRIIHDKASFATTPGNAGGNFINFLKPLPHRRVLEDSQAVLTLDRLVSQTK